MPMDAACRQLFTDVEAYLDGELDVAACRRLEDHAAACASCGDEVERLRRTIGLCREAGRAQLPEAVRQRARAAVRQLLARARE